MRSLIAAAVLPGTVTVVVPWLIVTSRTLPRPYWPAFGVVALGAAILLRCIREFAVVGRGTLAPVDPPTRLVVSGLYRHVRNPMYVGIMVILSGEAWAFQSGWLAIYAAAFFVVANVFIALHEEPALRRKFGAPYDEYLRNVPRWVPRRRPGDVTRRERAE